MDYSHRSSRKLLIIISLIISIIVIAIAYYTLQTPLTASENHSFKPKTTLIAYRAHPPSSLLTSTHSSISSVSKDQPVVQHKTSAQSKYKNLLNRYNLFLDPEAGRRVAPQVWWETRSDDAELLDRLARIPTAIWFGDWNKNIASDTKARLSTMETTEVAVVVVYNIPHRDCGSYSAGGAISAQEYKNWIDDLNQGMGDHHSIILLEPDALAAIDCLSTQDQTQRYELLGYAVERLIADNRKIYLDAGNSAWQSPQVIAQRLSKAKVNIANGFVLNISNFMKTESEIAYGNKIASLTNNKHFIIDTSRNGLGPTADYAWCNPPNRATGQLPTLNTGQSLVDAYLWIKVPGESDGECNGGPHAGVWWPEYALDIAKRGNL